MPLLGADRRAPANAFGVRRFVPVFPAPPAANRVAFPGEALYPGDSTYPEA